MKEISKQKKAMYDELFHQSDVFLKDFARTSKDGYASWFYFLKNHKDYDQNFWAHEDEEGRHVLFQLLEKHGQSALYIWDEWRQETNDKLIPQKDSRDRTILHYMWSAVEKELNSSYRSNFDFFKAFREAQENVPVDFWTFLDKKIDHPGEGWLNALLRVDANDYANINQKADIEKITQNIAKAFPQKPQASWWFSCKNAAQMNNFLSRGLSLQDEVCVGNINMPFVDWLFSTGSNYKLQSEIKSAKLLPPEEIERLSSKDNHMNGLIPSDRRSSVGYIKKIINCKQKDSLGRSSFDYCLMHRSDLLDLLCSAIYAQSPEETEFFCCDDINGFSFAARASIYLDEASLGQLKRTIQSKGIPFVVNKKETGWFDVEHNQRHWIKILSRYTSLRSLWSFKDPDYSLTDMFGDSSQQQKWVNFWEDNFEKSAASLERKQASPIKRALLRQATAWYNHQVLNNSQDKSLNPDLENIYKTAIIFLIQSGKQPDLTDHWASRVTLPSAYNIDKVFPTNLTKATASAVLSSPIFAANKSSSFSEKNKEMVVLASRTQLFSSVNTDKNAPSHSPRKM